MTTIPRRGIPNSTAAGRVKAAAARIAAAAARVDSASTLAPVPADVDAAALDAAVADPLKPAPGVEEVYLPCLPEGTEDAVLVYRAALLGRASVRYESGRPEVELRETIALLAPLGAGPHDNPWVDAARVEARDLESCRVPAPEARFDPLPDAAARPESYPAWAESLAETLRRTSVLTLFACEEPDALSSPGESKESFVERLTHLKEARASAAVAARPGLVRSAIAFGTALLGGRSAASRDAAPAGFRVQRVELRPGDGGVAVSPVVLAWTPWRVAPDGASEPAFR